MNESIPDSTPQFKQCYACGETFPATPEFFPLHNQKKDGLFPRCRPCNRSKRTPHHQEEIPEGYKKCCKCKQVIVASMDFFGRDKSRKDGFAPACTECRKNYVHSNKTWIYENNRTYRQTHKEQLSASDAQRRVANHETVRERERRYRSTERGRAFSRAANHKRKAIKKATPGTLTAEQIRQKLKSQGGRCYYAACGHAKFAKVDGKYIYHIEHTVPLSRTELNPRHDPDFTVLACPSCNLSKHDKAPWEWLEGGRLF